MYYIALCTATLIRIEKHLWTVILMAIAVISVCKVKIIFLVNVLSKPCWQCWPLKEQRPKWRNLFSWLREVLQNLALFTQRINHFRNSELWAVSEQTHFFKTTPKSHFEFSVIVYRSLPGPAALSSYFGLLCVKCTHCALNTVILCMCKVWRSVSF